MIARRGVCLVVAAPSGGGKSSLLRALLADDPDVALSVSVTTRAPRPGETDGVDYWFRSAEAFERMAASGDLLEWAIVFGRGYGTPRAPVADSIAAGRDVAFDIDWQGFRSLRARWPGDVVGVFVLPPDLDALQLRLAARGDPDPAEIARRMAQAREEMSHAPEFDYVIVNDNFDDALGNLRAILSAARCAAARLEGLHPFLAAL